MISLITICMLSYLSGSIPTAVIVSRIVLKDDIRNHGSGNAGATNVFRVMGWKPALFVFLVDVGKGVLATLFISRFQLDPIPVDSTIVMVLAGFFAVIGHIWTVFARFKGGKGMGTALGMLLSLAPIPTLITLAVWITLVSITRIVSVGSVAAGITLPAVLMIQSVFFCSEIHRAILTIGFVIGALVVITHRSNIKRLLRGEENRFGSGRSMGDKK